MSGAIDAAHLEHQRAWSTATFGPPEVRGPRGPLAHARKELDEVAEDPSVLEEWVDVVILAFDGALRAGHEPQAIIDAVKAKQAKNERREWPDWRGVPVDQPIEHKRHLDPCPDAQQAAQAPVSRPNAAPVDSGANGRLNEGPCARCGTDDDTCCITIGGGGPHCCEACRATDGRTHPKPEGVGTGAGEGAPRQDTGSAWVTRSTDCPEAPAQAHPLVGRLSERQRAEIGWAVERDWQLRDQQDDWDSLHAVVERIVREHTERAWDEGKRATWSALGAPFVWAAPENPYRAAREEQS